MAKSEFQIITTLRDEESGLVGVITHLERHKGFSGFSFALFKEFKRSPGSPTERTSYLNERHLGPARRMLDAIEERIKSFKFKGE